MISLFHFIGLDLNEKAEYVWQGTHIATRTDSEHRILLYRLDDYYAEVFYHAETNVITDITGFRANSKLVPYLPSRIR